MVSQNHFSKKSYHKKLIPKNFCEPNYFIGVEMCSRVKHSSLFLPKSELMPQKSFKHFSPCYKTFFGTTLRIFVKSYSVYSCQAYQPSLMFVGKAKRLSKRGAPFNCSTLVGFGSTNKH